MRIDGDIVKFRNGREEYANCGVVGIGKNESNKLVLSGGYDDGFPGGEPLTKSERQEIAAYMIEKWAQFGVKEVI